MNGVYGTALAALRRVSALACLLAAVGAAAEPLDPIQQAVVDSLDTSLGLPGGESTAALLEAAIKAADVDAAVAAERYLARLATRVDEAGGQAADMLADLADSADESALVRLERMIRDRQPAASRLVRAIREAGRSRRRDPDVLGRRIEGLGDADPRRRRESLDQLARAGVEALPALVPLLDPGAGEGPRRELASGLIRRLGDTARQPLLDWLGNGDPSDWVAVIEALRVAAVADVEPFLYAPVLVPDTPAPVREAARRTLAAIRRGPVGPPSRSAAIVVLGSRLDRLLKPSGLPLPDRLPVAPATDLDQAEAVGDGTVDRWFWDPARRTFAAVAVPPRAARAREAMHLARDLQALGVTDERLVDLVLLARLEMVLVTAGDPLTAVDRLPPAALREALAGPDGFSVPAAGRVFEQALEREMRESAAAAAAACNAAEDAPSKQAAAGAGLLPDTRESLVRALAADDVTTRFAAARTLALAAGDAPYRGSSRVVETLLHAATSTGRDRAIVAHPDPAGAHELAAGVSRFGYDPIRVSSGRDAIVAARGSADTVLVLLAARVLEPSAFETAQLLRQQGLGDVPTTIVVVDPLDEVGRGRPLANLILSFSEVEGVAVADRVDGLFEPLLDPETRERRSSARFPDLLALAAGPRTASAASRNAAAAVRLTRAREALSLLGRLGRRGRDVSAALETAELALLRQELYAPAASLLATIGRPEAQLALAAEAARTDLPENARLVAKTAHEASVERWGRLRSGRQMLTAYGGYNPAADDTARRAAGAGSDGVEAAGRKNPVSPADAPPLRPRR